MDLFTSHKLMRFLMQTNKGFTQQIELSRRFNRGCDTCHEPKVAHSTNRLQDSFGLKNTLA